MGEEGWGFIRKLSNLLYRKSSKGVLENEDFQYMHGEDGGWWEALYTLGYAFRFMYDKIMKSQVILDPSTGSFLIK